MSRKVFILALVLLSIQTSLSVKCEPGDHEFCQANFDPFSECVSTTCLCSEFFHYDNSDKCSKGSSVGKPCKEKGHCTVILGVESRCNPDKKVCECFSEAARENGTYAYFEGKCYLLKSYGEACSSDYQCMLNANGVLSNPLGRCIDNACGCHDEHGLPSMWMEGHPMCMVHCPDCKVVDISILTVTLAGSVGLVLFVYVMYRLATESNVEEKKDPPQNNHNHASMDPVAP